MIETYNDLKLYLAEDYKANHISNGLIRGYVRGGETVRYVTCLRICEYLLNTKHRILYYLMKTRLKRMQIKYGIFIEPNTFGYGLWIVHPGGIIVNPKCYIGNYCVLHHNVTIGNDGKIDMPPRIGNHCFIGANACVIGPLELGNEVTIGAGAVVTRSYGDRCTLIGVPAHIK